MRCGVGLLAMMVIAMVGGTAHGATVPVDALGLLGDEHLVFPPYVSAEKVAPASMVSAVGDVNGDGIEDIAVGIESWEDTFPARTWVTYSPATLPATLNAGEEGWKGLTLVAGRGYFFGIAGVGDVNGDGFADVAVATSQGVAVVFGRAASATIDLANLGNDGFRVTNLYPCGGNGYGTGYHGSTWDNTTLTGIGDQNGDGHPDLAVCEILNRGRSATIVYTPPNPAGKTIDASVLGAQGSRLVAPASIETGPFVGDLGDIDDDGRADLAATWSDENSGAAHAVGTPVPPAGQSLPLAEAASSGRGFELVAPDTHMENGVVVGDQNGDGTRDIGIIGFGRSLYRNRFMTIGFTPPLGTTRTITPAAEGQSFDVDVWNGGVIDVGDQDGDGIDDLAYSSVIRFSSTGRVHNQAPGTGLGGAIYFGYYPGLITAAVTDRNGDGKREIVAVYADPYNDPHSPSGTPDGQRATWQLDVFQSAMEPVPQTIDPPLVLPDGGILFAGTFTTTHGSETRSLGARPTLELSDGQRPVGTVSGDVVDASGTTTHAALQLNPASVGLVPGHTYSYRFGLENGRGLVGRGAVQSFTYGSAASAGPGAGLVPPRRDTKGRPQPIIARGTRLRDVLRGGPLADTLRGLGGDDLLVGEAGRDRLYGGTGRDRIDGGAGDDELFGGTGADRIRGRGGADVIHAADGARDVVLCGPGRDVVFADASDRLVGCERVRR